MKKTWIMVLSMMLTGLLTMGCGADAKETVQPAAAREDTAAAPSAGEIVKTAGGQSRTLVVYFSCTGNTRRLATNAAQALGADLYEIVPAEPYTEADLNYNNENSRVSKEHKDSKSRPAIAGKLDSLAAYDTVVIAYPIWWGEAPNIVDTFMESYDFSGKTMVPLCTAASSDIGSSGETLQGLGSPTAKWIAGRKFSPTASVVELKDWFAAQQLTSAS